ncbi:hypothetical protein C8J57DRAFT_1229665 [Mycena rebaudengoi]|nr:hypothetical protein C8J57DRAFT_1229665 [Mycena rebaudengoi]
MRDGVYILWKSQRLFFGTCFYIPGIPLANIPSAGKATNRPINQPSWQSTRHVTGISTAEEKKPQPMSTTMAVDFLVKHFSRSERNGTVIDDPPDSSRIWQQ